MFTTTDCCSDCSSQVDGIVCRCLQVSEETVLHAVENLGCRTLCDLRRTTGAGTGCNCCHQRLHQYLEAGRRSLAMAQ
ncbi:MAG TPA: (2Fe-2S)-binding protein [Gemmataceae bacterium]|nr:(2Fe-2S)-binding protein [Gemmataceae bacterium]